MRLFAYWRSSASWRVRIGLNLKGLSYDVVPVHLVRDGGEQRQAQHSARNPMRQVPVLELDDGTMLSQSIAILEYLDEAYPQPALLPSGAVDRARVRQLAEIVNAGIQPLQNLTVLQFLAANDVDKTAWAQRVIGDGLQALERSATTSAGDFLVGDAPSIADLCLVPQLYNARRFNLDVQSWPLLASVEARCEALPAFQRAHPDQQPDAQ